MKKKNRGFTLVEVIVTITILGITTLVALPVISTLQGQLNNNKYKVYQDSLESAAKLYTDSYDYDMFGYNDSGCVEIPYSELNSKSLLENIEVDNISCANADTKVYVIKNNGTFEYQSSLKCLDENGNVIFEKSNMTIDSCVSGVAGATPQLDARPGVTDTPVKKIDDIEVLINSNAGVMDNLKLTYNWYKKSDPDHSIASGKINYSNLRRDGAVTLKQSISSPKNLNGTYTLKITPVYVYDYSGEHGNTTDATFGDYVFDNTKPTINVNYDMNKSTNNVTVHLTDNIELSAYAASTTNEVPAEDSDLWKSASGTDDTHIITLAANTYYFFVKDSAGNTASVSEEIKIDRPTAPSISGGADGWYTTNRIIWVTTPSTSLGKIKKYQYCVSTTKNTGTCSWTDLFDNNAGVSNSGLDIAYYHSNNSDLITTFGGSVPSLNNHYTQFGASEGRALSDPNAQNPEKMWIRDSQNFSYEGDRYVYFRGVTEGGLVSPASNVQHLKIDKSAPKVTTFNVTSTKSFNSRAIRVAVAGTDTVSGIQKVCYSLSTSASSYTCASGSSHTFSVTLSASEGSGANYAIYAKVIDNAGVNSAASSKGYKLYSNCTSKKLNCNYGWDDGSRPCTVSHGNGWGRKGRYCYYYDNYTGVRCNSELRTCPCDNWCDRDGMTNIPFDPVHKPQYNRYWQGYGGSCVRPFCSDVLCENNACRPAGEYH